MNTSFLICYFVLWRKPQTCNRSRQTLATYDPLFNDVTGEMFDQLTKKIDSMTSLVHALDVYYNQSDKIEKGFLDLFLVLGKNNVSEVIFCAFDFVIKFIFCFDIIMTKSKEKHFFSSLDV